VSGEVLECDFLVIGAGMAGLSAAGWAAERGARVVVVEKADAIGGSAVLSGGMLWTAASPQKMALYGGGDPRLGKVVCERYPDALAWLRKRGIHVSPAMKVLHGYGYQIDIVEHLRGCVDLVEQGGGYVALGTTTATLLKDDDGRVTGARTAHEDGQVDIHARHTLLATGGFQGSEEMRARLIHENARKMLLRSNPHSTGEGLELGRAAGGEVRGTNKGFYGHLVSRPNAWGEERYFTMLSQYHSDHALLFNEAGERFCDETFGDHTNTCHTVAQANARAICVWDARVQADHATKPIVAIAPPMDKFAVAIENGGEGVVAHAHEALAAFAGAHGFDGTAMIRSLKDYDLRAKNGWETLNPPRTESCLPMDRPPWYALVVYPAITFTFGGLTIDERAQVLDGNGAAVAGLFAAGSDAGDAFGLGYAGGLALAMTFGMTAARTAGWN
jgi:succinate dehydrogenase/fumarate reductase flavoprotein subunit